jgi:type IV secretory pathway ATPase VirB11/archaellum biosynthesis ATPase
MVCEYEYDEENQTMRISCLGCIHGSSIEDFDVCMAKTIDKLAELKKPVRIVFAERMEHEYDFSDSKLLLEIALALEKISKGRIISLDNIVIKECEEDAGPRYALLQKVYSSLRYDPIEAYKELLREIRHVKVKMENENELKRSCYEHYLDKALLPIKNILDDCELIRIAANRLSEHKNRSLYRDIFNPSVRPNFMYTRYIITPPANSELIERYNVGKTIVEIYKLRGRVRKFYHMIPPEFRLKEEEYSLLDNARRLIGKHEPREAESAEPARLREALYRIGLDMLTDLSKRYNIKINEERFNELANILTRYTAGLGILELFLEDEKIQDIFVNSPVGQLPVFIFHSDHEQCETNIVPSREDADSWATRFRLMSGRPLDEANPVLDTEMSVKGGRARVAAITRTLSPEGLGFALRRHREKPWTFPLFINNRMIDPFSAALLWFVMDGSRTMLIAGTRSSGKTSFLGACMVQIMPKLRTITVEDTLELPVEALRELGYNIERMKSRSVITRVETELPAEEALRTALRLGDSCLIVGEVRSVEALALFEAMRIGALANVVAGTIHGDSAYGVFDRVVNDLGVPPTSFKAMDIIAICNMLKTPDGMHSFRRIMEITEVRKHWKTDPLDEGGFVNLMEYSAKEDKLRPSKTLLMGESFILSEIASRTREWKGRWDAVWNNIKLRENIMKTLVEYANNRKKPELLEALTVIQSNSQFHLISDEVRQEVGELDSNLIYERWLEWLRKQ